MMRAGAVLLCACALAISTDSISAQPASGSSQAERPSKFDIRSRPIDSFDPRDPQRRKFGSLVFRGGIELSSSNKQFGGLSALRVAANGTQFVALTDRANWITGRIQYRGEAPSGIADAEVAPMLYSDGRPITSRGWYDTEAMAEDSGTIYVALERVHRILRFDFGKRGLLARGALVPVPPELGKLPSNKGIECLLVAPKGSPLGGALIAISERGLDEAQNIRGFLIGGPKPGTFAVKPSEDFDVVDCALTPKQDVLILERHFSLRRGVAMRIRKVPLVQVLPGAVLEGEVLISADMGFQIDNMEGLSVHRASNGEVVLTLVSDDNFSFIQRTILLQFTLME